MDLNKEWYRNEFLHHEFMYERITLESELSFYEAVVNGDMEKVELNCTEKDFANLEGMGQLSYNPMQNLRYHFVVTVAMITRYCVHAGMEQNKAYALSDYYILKMDQCTTEKEISKLHDTMSRDFCKQMGIVKKNMILSKPIVLCLDYIYAHIHYRITVAELAEYLNLSQGYLSSLFKSEMGMPVSDYIMNLKIENACNLLRFSDYSLSEIANYLAFATESHFIQSFKKKMGMTPNRYRKTHFRTDWNAH